MDEMKDCIYRKEATEFIDKCLNHEEKLQSVERETLIAVKKYLDSIPTADVVEAVRCKDCKNRFNIDVCKCRGDDWFCGYGERKVK